MNKKLPLYLLFIVITLLPLINADKALILFEGEEGAPIEPPPEPPAPEPQIEPPQNEPPLEPPQDQPQMPPQEEPPFEEPPKDFGGQEVPEGCVAVETGTGMSQMQCDFEASEPEFQEFDIKEEIDSCQGKFEMINGKPTCIKEGKEGFVGVTCPTPKELDSIKSNCKSKIEEFTDDKGCTSIMCVNEKFKEQYNEKIEEKYGHDPIKAQAIQCQKDGGEFMLIENQPRCLMEFDEPIRAGKIKEMTPEEMTDLAEKLNKTEESIGFIGEKLEKLKIVYQSKGDTQTLNAIEYAIEKLGSVQIKLNSIKNKLNAGTATHQELEEMFTDLKSLRKEVSKITKAMATGTVPTIEEIEAKVKEQMDVFYHTPFENEEEFKAFLEKEKSAMEMVHTCHKYDLENIKSFVPPDPEGFITNASLYFDGTNCLMTLTTKEGKKAEFTLTEEEYKNFSDPSVFASIPCSGDCTALNEIFSMAHGPGGVEEECMEACIQKDCSKSMFECMFDNKEKCELTCGLRKEGEGPFVDGQIDPFQGCIMVCVGEENARECGPNTTNPKCIECEEKCMKEYGPGIGYEHCLNEEQMEAKQEQCQANNQYGKPVESPTPDGKMCISDVICKNFDPNEWGDNPGTGPDNWEPGHGPGEEYGPPTGNVILDTGKEVISRIIGFFTGWFK
ncbi:hypothetical protein KKG83_02445 [Candidatus Micrarchaeota archaeon]|nr:hypothetical protein [Candidatus Micrarchaeota archaeon]MBU2476309.1 hypothetical protein [Candidatus Micrarchaeota archaeon]